ncbi:MAG: prenyltransferase [Dysgonamonadaceae bacterium]|jgi:1,4-dihydroxy-2-naphthoate octaprenyltransferase|nr:prenyltransferase [Dysgonamonadaceae bacterium]
MNNIKFWFKAARPQALPQSMMPAVLALCLASEFEGFSLLPGLFAVFGVMMGHLGSNLLDDYFDYRKKCQNYREQMVHEGFRARISKCAYLNKGEATVRQLLVACIIFCAISLSFGAIVWYYRGINIIYFAMIASFLGISYSGAPLRLSYHGFGEVIIALMFGPLLMTGVFYSACGSLSPLIIFVSIPVGLLVCNIVYVHSILDFEPDRKVGKMTLAVLLNNKKYMLTALAVILFAPYLIVALSLILYFKESLCLILTFSTLPLAIVLFRMMIEFTGNSQKKYEPERWMGPMPQWAKYREAGIDWFMIRWLLARNLLSLFCLSIIISWIISMIFNHGIS